MNAGVNAGVSAEAEVRVSVIMPAYDAAATIGVQLDALARQRDAPPWELIVADNGSNDATAAIAAAWRGAVPQLVVLDAAARPGPAAARNIAAATARGDRLLFCDADDAADPGWVRELAHALTQADAASGARRYDALNSAAHGPSDWPDPVFRAAPLPQLAAASSHNLGVRAAAFRAVGGFDETLRAGEDVDLCWRLQLDGFSFAAAPGAVMQIRRRARWGEIFRQAYAYGGADRLLVERYGGTDADAAEVGEVGALEAPAPPPSPHPHRGPDPAFAVHRWGRLLGSRFGARS